MQGSPILLSKSARVPFLGCPFPFSRLTSLFWVLFQFIKSSTGSRTSASAITAEVITPTAHADDATTSESLPLSPLRCKTCYPSLCLVRLTLPSTPLQLFASSRRWSASKEGGWKPSPSRRHVCGYLLSSLPSPFPLHTCRKPQITPLSVCSRFRSSSRALGRSMGRTARSSR